MHPRSGSLQARSRRWQLLFLCLSPQLFACSSKEGATTAPPGPDGGSIDFEAGPIGVMDAADEQDANVAFTIAPANPAVTVTIEDGVVSSVLWDGAGDAGALVFEARTDVGARLPAAWSFDRDELGAVVAGTGAFTPSGNLSGTGTVTATYGGTTVSTEVRVRIHAIQNGRPAVAPPLPALGGVGGEGLGGKVADDVKARLKGTSTAPASSQELGWLYPYDKTVWPRGIFPPLLQWQTTHTDTVAVYVHLAQKDFEFEGFYAGDGLVHEPIDATAWRQALLGNYGDALHVEIKTADASTAYGPIAEDWTIAPGYLKGTVYYNSYRTTLATPVVNTVGYPAAAVLAIKAGATDPVLALPGTGSKCIVCHVVSDDGSTLFAQEGLQPGDDYSNGASYDLRNSGAVIQSYTGTATDGTTNNRKFLWSAPWTDGTFVLQSAEHTPEAYEADSKIFRRDDATAMPAAGFDGVVKEAVTPAFSHDGSKIAFDYWTAADGVGGDGDGHTLDVMDFACGPAVGHAPGTPSCGTFTFSGLRRLYTNTDTVNGFVGWPAWLPDSRGIIFHNTVKIPDTGSPLATWYNAKAQIWFTDVPVNPADPSHPIRLNALNGLDANGVSYLPTVSGTPAHDDDVEMNYEPTVNPIPSGGYYWVVFTSRRSYGNVAQGDPYDTGDGTYAIPKKLWVAAVDLSSKAGVDPSHPAFYLPGQELNAGNMRGFWEVDPCQADGATCSSGDECCNGYCQAGDDGKFVCASKPRNNSCSQEFEKCSSSTECCGSNQGYGCVNERCARVTIVR